MKHEDLAAILTCPLFVHAESSRLAADIESLPYRMTTVEDGQSIMWRNDPYNELIIIVSGSLEAYQEDRRGHHLIVETLRAPEAVATAMLFAPEPKIPVSLRAVGTGRLFFISRDSLLRLCSRYPPILLNLLNDMGRRAVYLAEKLRYLTFSSIRQKLAVYLLEKVESGEPNFRVNKEHLAELFGVTRPSLSRVCVDLSDRGIINMKGRNIVITDPRAVRLMVENMGEL